MKKRKLKKEGHLGLLFATLICALSFIISLFIFSLLLLFLENPVSLVSLFSLLAYLVSAAASAFINSKRKGEGGTVFAILSSLLASAVFFSVGLVGSRGKLELSLLMNILCYILVSALFARLGSLKPKRHKRFKH